MNNITQRTTEKLGYYVYLLKDPRDGKIFYVGKGKGRRIFSHDDEALVVGSFKSEKLQIIRSINRSGMNIERLVLRHGLKSEEEAYKIEAVAIDLLGNQLTNVVRGHHSVDNGIMSIREIELKYQAKDADFSEPAILISIDDQYMSSKDNETKLYNASRKHWRISRKRASQISLVCAVYRGIIRETYIAKEWKPSKSLKGRSYFVGQKAPEPIRNKYINKSVASYWKKGSQNPNKYVFS